MAACVHSFAAITFRHPMMVCKPLFINVYFTFDTFVHVMNCSMSNMNVCNMCHYLPHGLERQDVSPFSH